MPIDLNVSTEVFNSAFLPWLSEDTKSDLHSRPTQIFFGGSASGKSVFLAQRAVLDVAQGGRNYLILRKVQRDCRKSVWNEVIKQIKRFDLWDYVQTNKTELTITFPNNYQILFGGLDDRERIKSLVPEKDVITDIWMEEATEFEEDDLKQLNKRLRGGADVTKRICMSFNPIIKQHWIFERFFTNWDESETNYSDERLSIMKTTYKNNKFLSEDDIERLESEDDDYFRQVYVLGNWGVLGNVIFKNWETQDLSGKRGKMGRPCHGLDFGFHPDPAAVLEQEFNRSQNKLYVFNEIYETNLSNEQLADKVVAMIGDEEVVCDSAEPKSIEKLKQEGVNAVPAEKGKGSIKTSYKWLSRSVDIVIDPKCVNLKRELQTHQRKTDRYGEPKPKPEDKNNHAIDGMRYGTEEYWQTQQNFEVLIG